MMRFTQRLPIILIPEQLFVAFVVYNMIDIGSRYDSTVGLAMDAERVVGEITRPCFTPRRAVSPLVSATPILIIGSAGAFMVFAVTVSYLYQLSTARFLTSYLSSLRHFSHPLRNQDIQ